MCSVCLEEVVPVKVSCRVCKEIMCGSCHDKYPLQCPVCVQPRGSKVAAKCSENDQLCQWFEARGLSLSVNTFATQDPVAFFEQITGQALRALQELEVKEPDTDTIIKALTGRFGLAFLLAMRYEGEITELGICSQLATVKHVLLIIKSPHPGQSYLAVWVQY
jgi:hypothetical protein